jgi:hypothetical protein
MLLFPYCYENYFLSFLVAPFSDSGFDSTSTDLSSKSRLMPLPISMPNLQQQNGHFRTSPVKARYSPKKFVSPPAASTFSSSQWSRPPQQPAGGIVPTQNIEDDSTYFDDDNDDQHHNDEPFADQNTSQSQKGEQFIREACQNQIPFIQR